MSSPAQAKFEDSNIANLGTQAEKDHRMAAAHTAEEWKGCGQKEGVEVWRIEKLKVVPWPKDSYGSFYDGDSYIILHTYKDPEADKFLYNIHFWLGKDTSIDEAGVAAYKTVELDDYLAQLPVEFREVQGYESEEFLSLWKPSIRLLSGGIETGFNIVKPEEYKPRLLHVKGTKKHVRVTEVPLTCDSLNSGDVFILDAGLNIYQWNGIESAVAEKRRGNEVAHGIQDERNGRPKLTIMDGEDDAPEFWEILGGKKEIKSAIHGGADEKVSDFVRKVFKVNDPSGTVSFTEVASGNFTKSVLKADGIFLVDTETQVFVWIGSRVSKNDKSQAFMVANKYMQEFHRPMTTAVLKVVDPAVNAAFEALFIALVKKPSLAPNSPKH
eukprot:TRINITY_DN3025_c0_g2_i1.p1 TRINITY_DN3025_c0_g2~~TRINITY_DN3025_c0_g2_i1.p1  ORF type:complete len:383 (+),score=100.23 TRINITY_DN3025_c0_g2_i1:75-1223(+)